MIQVPQQCQSINWRLDTIYATVPYGGFEKVKSEFAAVGAGHESTTALLDTDEKFGIGWHTKAEENLIADLYRIAHSIDEDSNGPMPSSSVRSALKKLVKEARKRLDGVQEAYDAYYSGYPDEWPLDDPGYVKPWPQSKQDATRKQIRELIDAAGTLLACALLGLAQAESYMGNKAAYEATMQGFAPQPEEAKFPSFTSISVVPKPKRLKIDPEPESPTMPSEGVTAENGDGDPGPDEAHGTKEVGGDEIPPGAWGALGVAALVFLFMLGRR